MSWLNNHWLDVVGWGGSAILVYSLLQARVLRFRTINLLGCAILLVFNAILGIWPMVGMNAVLGVINVWFIVQLVRQRHDESTYTALEVGSDDAYLRHVLRVHAPDIAKFQPDFEWEPIVGRDRAFVVIKGDETVGVVLLQADGDVARVRLDFVTPRYRDFSIGEFVWRTSGLLKDSGFRQVVTSPHMVDPYYERVGFRREGEAFVLDL